MFARVAAGVAAAPLAGFVNFVWSLLKLPLELVPAVKDGECAVCAAVTPRRICLMEYCGISVTRYAGRREAIKCRNKQSCTRSNRDTPARMDGVDGGPRTPATGSACSSTGGHSTRRHGQGETRALHTAAA